MRDRVYLDHTPKKAVPTVYGLADPGDALFRYVGQTIDTEKRLQQHLKGRDFIANPSKARWIEELRAAGREPVLVVLEVCDSWLELDDAERKWIRKLKEEDHPLLNMTEGGTKVRGATRAGVARKRDWIELGYTMKCANAALQEAMSRVQALTGLNSSEARAVEVAMKKVASVSNALDERIYRDFPSWADFAKVFYGVPEEHFARLKKDDDASVGG